MDSCTSNFTRAKEIEMKQSIQYSAAGIQTINDDKK